MYDFQLVILLVDEQPTGIVQLFIIVAIHYYYYYCNTPQFSWWVDEARVQGHDLSRLGGTPQPHAIPRTAVPNRRRSNLEAKPHGAAKRILERVLYCVVGSDGGSGIHGVGEATAALGGAVGWELGGVCWWHGWHCRHGLVDSVCNGAQLRMEAGLQPGVQHLCGVRVGMGRFCVCHTLTSSDRPSAACVSDCNAASSICTPLASCSYAEVYKTRRWTSKWACRRRLADLPVANAALIHCGMAWHYYVVETR